METLLQPLARLSFKPDIQNQMPVIYEIADRFKPDALPNTDPSSYNYTFLDGLPSSDKIVQQTQENVINTSQSRVPVLVQN
jgi:hypothetical protein